MLLAIGAIIVGLALLVWSADKFVDAATAKRVLRHEFPLLLIATAVMTWCLFDAKLDIIDGLLLLVLLVLMMWYLVQSHRRTPAADWGESELTDIVSEDSSLLATSGWVILSLILLVSSSKLLV